MNHWNSVHRKHKHTLKIVCARSVRGKRFDRSSGERIGSLHSHALNASNSYSVFIERDDSLTENSNDKGTFTAHFHTTNVKIFS